MGNNSDFGNWKEKKYKLELYDNYVWRTKYKMKKNSSCVEFKLLYFTLSWNTHCRGIFENIPRQCSEIY